MATPVREDALSRESSLYVPRLARVADVRVATATEKIFDLEMEDGQPLGHDPGQFLMVSVNGIGEAPISICTSPTEDAISLCIRSAGMLTVYLHGLEPGAWIGIRGPYGTGFPMEEMTGKDLLFVAGGIGMAPLRSAIRYALDHRDRYGRITILYGASTPSSLLFSDEIESWTSAPDVRVLVTADRGEENWAGNVGVITSLFPQIQDIQGERTVAMVVGPPVMYRFVMLELTGLTIPQDQILFSLERRMKCGVGKCGHCQINGTYVCQEGPVFRYPRLARLWEAVERVGPIGRG